MSRSLTLGVESAIVASEVRPAFFVFLDLVGGPVRVWSGIGTYTLGGYDYTGLGQLGGISDVEEATRLTAFGINLTLTGIPSSYISLVLNEPYRNRHVFISLGFFDSSDALISDPVDFFAGRINTMALQDTGDSATVTLTAESRLIDLERPRESRYTHEEQMRLHPGDIGLEYVASIQNATLYWGIGTTTQPAPTPSVPFVRRIM